MMPCLHDEPYARLSIVRSTPSEPRVAIENEGRRASLVHCLIVVPGRTVSSLA